MILRFPTPAARAAFLDRIKVADSDVAGLVKPSYAQPTVVIVRSRQGLSEQRLETILSRHLDAGVEVFEDVQFSVMAPGQ